MRTRSLHLLAPATLGLILSALAVPAPSTDAETMDFAGAKAKAAAAGKLVLVDFSSPT